MQQNNGAPDRRILGFTKMVKTYKKHVPLTLRQEIQVNRMSNELREALDDKGRQVPLFISWLKWAISNYKNVVLRDKEHQATVLRYLAIIEAAEATVSNRRLQSTYENELACLSMEVESRETIAQNQPTNIPHSQPAAFFLGEITKYVKIIAPKITDEQQAQLAELHKLVISATAASTRFLQAEYEAKVSKMKNEVDISAMLDNLENVLASRVNYAEPNCNS
ncbi:Protein CBG27362 [Caenorhabditis briggsae]|uniref:Protein CBG27362 n=1 Tax=Caenorhabditis briggsae TaxID=6238 RepID=B6IGG2_CAEBR|nr:Protein CBG27362 [Caenorhabditis briggsae]CAR98992.1 Protein CBG27362 [Caenorhabditis briggsae]